MKTVTRIASASKPRSTSRTSAGRVPQQPPAPTRNDQSPNSKRARLMSCLTRMVSELDAVSASLATGGRMHGVLPADEAKRVRDALDNAWGEIVNAMPRAYPEELIGEFADL